MHAAPAIRIDDGFVAQPALLFAALQRDVVWDDRLRARKTASFGVPYDYSGLQYPEAAMPATLAALCDRLHGALGFRPNNGLLNFYEDGAASMGFHSDSSAELAAGTGVAIVSLGAERRMVFRSKQDRTIEFNYAMHSGALLYMPDGIQAQWLHAIPKAPGAGARISLTFRQIVRTP